MSLSLQLLLCPVTVRFVTCSKAYSEQIWVWWISLSKITQPLKGSGTLPSSTTSSSGEDFLWSDSQLSPLVLFPLVWQLWLCFACCTARQKDACCLLSAEGVSVTEQLRPLNLDLGSLLFPWDLSWNTFPLDVGQGCSGNCS